LTNRRGQQDVRGEHDAAAATTVRKSSQSTLSSQDIFVAVRGLAHRRLYWACEHDGISGQDTDIVPNGNRSASTGTFIDSSM